MRKRHTPTALLSSLVALFALLVNLAPASGAPLEQSGLQMEAWAAYDGNFKYGEWLPVYIEVENNGPDLQAEVQIRLTGSSVSSIFSAPAELPTGSRKLIPLYILPNNFTRTVNVQLISGQKELASQKISIKPNPNILYMIGIVSPERGALSLLNTLELPGTNRKETVIDFTLQDLPERMQGLRSFDLIILNNTDTSGLSPEQLSALESWVRQGGRLVIGGGAGALQTASGIPDSLLPLKPSGILEAEELSLEAFAGDEPILVPGPFVIANGVLNQGTVLAGDDSLPLVVEKTVGGGYVDFIALDVSRSPFDAWSGAKPFWETLISPRSAYPDWLPPDMSARQLTSSQMSYALSNLPALDLPSIRSLAILLGIYIILVGPLNYLFLRWRKRLQFAWVTIPVITLLFSGGAFGLGYAMRGNDLIMNKIVVAELQPGGSANVRTYYGLFSPAQTSYEIEVNSGDLLSPLNPDYDPWSSSGISGGGEVAFVQGNPARVRGLSVNQWSMQSFTSEGIWTDFGEVKSDLNFKDGKLEGTITNATQVDLTNLVIVMGTQVVHLDDLAIGDTIEVDLVMPDLISMDFGPPLSYRIFEQELNRPMPNGFPRELQLKQSVIDSLFPYGGSKGTLNAAHNSGTLLGEASALFIGWFADAPSDVTVSGRTPAEVTTGVVAGNLPFHLVAEEGTLFLPPGLVPVEIVEMPLEGGTCGPAGSAAVYLGRGKAVLEFQLPSEVLNAQLEKMVLHIGTDGGWDRAPVTEIYQWSNEAWATVDNVVIGNNIILETDGLISDLRTVRVRISSDENFFGGCYVLGLGLEGVW